MIPLVFAPLAFLATANLIVPIGGMTFTDLYTTGFLISFGAQGLGNLVSIAFDPVINELYN